MAKIIKLFIKTCIILLIIVPILYIVPFVFIALYDDETTHIAGSYYLFKPDNSILRYSNDPDNQMHEIDADNFKPYENSNIPPTVLTYETNGRYITVRQKPFPNPDHDFYPPVKYPDHAPNNIYYWIINTDSHTRIGPLKYSSFLDECRKLHIDPRLTFQSLRVCDQ